MSQSAGAEATPAARGSPPLAESAARQAPRQSAVSMRQRLMRFISIASLVAGSRRRPSSRNRNAATCEGVYDGLMAPAVEKPSIRKQLIESLPRRDQEIIKLRAQGLKHRQIGERLGGMNCRQPQVAGGYG